MFLPLERSNAVSDRPVEPFNSLGAPRGQQWYATAYNQYLETEIANEITAKLCRHHLSQLTASAWDAVGIHIQRLLDRGDFPGLVQLDPDVLDLAALDQYHVRQCLAFFAKRTDIDIGVDRRAVAVAKFRDAEAACALTNSCFRAWKQGRFQFRPLVERVLHAASIKISQVLGDVPSLSDLRPRFGPGATTQVPKKNACFLNKLRGVPACSANFTDPEEGLALVWAGNGKAEQWVDIEIHAAQLSFVAKNAKTERAICTEPALNGMFQLAVGDVIARRLRSVGIDIRDQRPNQEAARLGSISGETATLDLSSASDTVSLSVCEHLLSPDWYDLLCRLRSCEVQYGSEILELHKMSSMGNGFTFPLETLIFWALSSSVQDIYARHSKHRVIVYGDDIIVATDAAVPLISVLRDLGFTPNASKSFWTGSFRESCGKDYVSGTDVRPVFAKTREERGLTADTTKDPRMQGSDLFRIHNFYFDRQQFQAAAIVEGFIHPSIRLRGPTGYGDGYLHASAWVSKPAGRKKGWSGFSFDVWCYSAKRFQAEVLERWGTSSKGNVFHYATHHYRRIVRLATYATYLREESPTVDEMLAEHASFTQEESIQRGPRLLMPESHKDSDYHTIPGRGEVVQRTKVYIFESPAFTKI